MAIPAFNEKLPVKDIKWGNKTRLENEILGPDDDWGLYRQAHLWFDPKNAESKAGYKLPFARIWNGKLTAVKSQLIAAIAAINGARGGVDLSDADRRAAHALASRYLKKFDPGMAVPALKETKTMKMDRTEFLAYANEQIRLAKHDEPDVAEQRLAALQKMTDAARDVPEDGVVEVEAFKAGHSETTFDAQRVARNSDGKGAVASNLDDLYKKAKALSGKQEEDDTEEEEDDEEMSGKGKKKKAKAEPKDGEKAESEENEDEEKAKGVCKTGDDEWPDDINLESDEPAWGVDPD